eukprot:TRINITY_DN3238_c0_g2_i3.p1 TRINITY_DN3238_c0_g2~~TRINITY_DN3238_c0_g2_i3.p1  ORF type:complete len:536 (-),score=59.36 TRINITY_DN3238_c0_g2_i3:112-1719(-)
MKGKNFLIALGFLLCYFISGFCETLFQPDGTIYLSETATNLYTDFSFSSSKMLLVGDENLLVYHSRRKTNYSYESKLGFRVIDMNQSTPVSNCHHYDSYEILNVAPVVSSKYQKFAFFGRDQISKDVYVVIYETNYSSNQECRHVKSIKMESRFYFSSGSLSFVDNIIYGSVSSSYFSGTYVFGFNVETDSFIYEKDDYYVGTFDFKDHYMFYTVNAALKIRVFNGSLTKDYSLDGYDAFTCNTGSWVDGYFIVYCENYGNNKLVLFLEESNSKLLVKKQVSLDNYNFLLPSPSLAVGHNWFSVCDVEADTYIRYESYVDPGLVLKYSLNTGSEYIVSGDPHNYERFGVATLVTSRYTAYFSLFLDDYGHFIGDNVPKIGIKFVTTQMPSVRPVPPLLPVEPTVSTFIFNNLPQILVIFVLSLTVGCCLTICCCGRKRKNQNLPQYSHQPQPQPHDQSQSDLYAHQANQVPYVPQFDRGSMYQDNTQHFGFDNFEPVPATNSSTFNQQPQMQVDNDDMQNFVYSPPQYMPNDTFY